MGVHMIAEGAVVSRRPVPIHLQLVRCHSGPSNAGEWKASTSGESTSRKSLALGVVPGDGTEVRGGIHMNVGRVGEERGGKETDGCHLTAPLLLSQLTPLGYPCGDCVELLTEWFAHHLLVSHLRDIDSK
jgi:hypothetical protein